MTPNAVIWEQTMDPQDIVEYKVDCGPILEVGEDIASFSLSLPSESTLFGLELGTSTRAASRDGNIITMWFSFDGTPIATPVVLPVELTIVTTSTPSRTKQRTLGLKVDQL